MLNLILYCIFILRNAGITVYFSLFSKEIATKHKYEHTQVGPHLSTQTQSSIKTDLCKN